MRILTLLATAMALSGCVSGAVGRNDARGLTPAVAPAAMKTVPVLVYVTSWCPVCVRARAWLEARGYRYTPVDVEQNLEAALRLRRLSPRGSVPTFDVDGSILVGFDAAALHDAIARAAATRESRAITDETAQIP
jgi:glutaredoxin 3